MKITKSELKALIREALREELIAKKSLIKEAFEMSDGHIVDGNSLYNNLFDDMQQCINDSEFASACMDWEDDLFDQVSVNDNVEHYRMSWKFAGASKLNISQIKATLMRVVNRYKTMYYETAFNVNFDTRTFHSEDVLMVTISFSLPNLI